MWCCNINDEMTSILGGKLSKYFLRDILLFMVVS